jgi:integrase
MPFESANRTAYEAANRELLKRTDNLVAVWDGTPPQAGAEAPLTPSSRSMRPASAHTPCGPMALHDADERHSRCRRSKAGVPSLNALLFSPAPFVKVDRLNAPLLLSLMGLRPAEVCGLRWSDIDLDLARLSITNTRTFMGNRAVVEKDTKSMAGEHVLPLPALVHEALKIFRAMQAKERLAAGEGYEGGMYALVDELGAPLNGRQLRERTYKIMDENGLRRVRLYDARASCLTYLAQHRRAGSSARYVGRGRKREDDRGT